MKLYIYPQNLKATANLWLWCLRDFALICVGLLLSLVALTQMGLLLPLALTLLSASAWYWQWLMVSVFCSWDRGMY